MYNTIPKLVVFDLYGTLVKFGVAHHPFRELLKWARENGRPVNNNDARMLMTTHADLPRLASHLGIDAPKELLSDLQIKIDTEIAALSLFDDVIPVLTKLQQLGIPTAICSNLAQPYGVVIDNLLSQFQMHLFLSYEVGFIKPDQQIYDRIVDSTGIAYSSCLFVGDTYLADYEGPTHYGFQAKHLIRHQKSEHHVIGSLLDVISIFSDQ